MEDKKNLMLKWEMLHRMEEIATLKIPSDGRMDAGSSVGTIPERADSAQLQSNE